jgi:hypothetical protein
MGEQNQQTDTLKDIHDIRQIMERSSRFISLSGLSGIAAGLCALVGCFLARTWIRGYYARYNDRGRADLNDLDMLQWKLLLLAVAVLGVALVGSFYFTWRKARHDHQSIWNISSRRLAWNMMIPLAAGGLFVLSLWQRDEWTFIAPACLVFYGLALVNASKYTVSDIRYLGYLEIILGLINTQFPRYGLYFWGAGFGILHIVYGAIMWWKYERT